MPSYFTKEKQIIISHLLFLLLLVWQSCAFSTLAPVSYNNVSSTEGLPQNTARVLLQDRNGFVWVGTEDGLVRFDGYSMKSFRKQHDNSASLSDNYISSLAESRDGRIWAGTMGGGLNVINPQSGEVVRLKILPSSDILSIVQAPGKEELWLGTDSGLYLLDITVDNTAIGDKTVNLNESILTQIPLLLPDETPMENSVTGITLQDNDIWLSTRGKGIGHYRVEDNSVTWYLPGNLGLQDDTFNTITSDSNGTIWAGGQNHGLVQVIRNADGILFKHYNKENNVLAANDVMAITSGGNGKLWVGTWGGGLAMFNPADGTSEIHQNQVGDPHSLASDIVMDILTTRDGQVWVGTFDHGICWFNPEAPFHSYREKPNEEGGLPGNLIWSFASEPKNKLWIGTSKGLTRLNLDSQEYDIPENIQPSTLWNSVRKDDIRAILTDGDHLWIAARHNGLVRLTISTAKLTPITDLLKPGNKLTHSYIRVMMKDSHGYLWFGATKGLNRFDPKRGELLNFMPNKEVKLSLPHQRIRALFEDSKEQIWVGTSLGLMQINQQGNPVQVWQHTSSDIASKQILTGNGIRGLGEDFLGRIWIATEGGVSIFDQNTKEIILLREQNGLPSNAAYCAIPTEQYMWVSTLRGLARIDIKSLQIESYYSSDGLPDNEFNFNAWHKLADGRLAFGTLSGFTIFSPLRVPGPEKSRPAPPLQLQTYIYKENKTRIPVSALDSPVTVGWENNHIDFEYSALHFGTNDSVSYDALLQGVDNNWNSVGNQRLASYSGLAPGRYIFQIRAKDTHGQWQTETGPLHFTVTPPPWQTLWAYALYAILLAGFLLLAAMLYNRRLRNRAGILQLLVAERTAELEESSLHLADKNRTLDRLMKARERLFHALSHEIRTPLAVIMSVLESVQHNDSGATAKIPMARQSAKRLGRLLDNILELSCQKKNELQDNTPFQVQAALDEAIAPYELQAHSEGKTMLIETPLENAWLALPRNTFEMIISNLLSNSCKYTKPGDSISLKGNISKGILHITVQDSGIGIPDGMEENIFDWFERGSTNTEIDGWGIGLAFVREATEAAGGKIQLEPSENNIGAEFLLSIPLATADVSRLAIQNTAQQTEKINTEIMDLNQEKVRTLLLIEDDPDLLKLLPTIFPSHWICLTASMAETGLKMAIEKLPDLVLTDLMLPGESGFDLTRKLKEDSRTAHIPVIILTALNDEEHRLAGLGLSADSFMTKPFENQELLLRVQGLLSNRERVFERVKHLVIDLENEPQNDKPQNLATEDAFLQKLHKALTTESDLASITLTDAADKLAMSKRSFQREMQRRGISWREYKRMRKLRFAMDLLRDPTMRVGMVAEKAGYSSAAHFSKIFKQHIGVSPTKWQQEKQNDPEKLKN